MGTVLFKITVVNLLGSLLMFGVLGFTGYGPAIAWGVLCGLFGDKIYDSVMGMFVKDA